MYNDELIESSKIKWQSFLKGDDDAYAWIYSRYVHHLCIRRKTASVLIELLNIPGI